MGEKSYQNECSICFELLTDRSKDVGVLECNHKFHMECIYEWFSTANSNFKCPNCFVQRDIVAIIPQEGADLCKYHETPPADVVLETVRNKRKKRKKLRTRKTQ